MSSDWTKGLSLPIKYVGTLDLVNYKISYYLGYYLYLIGITPNMITLSGLICNFISSYGILINHDYYIIALPLATLLDCMDGYNARMFNQGSKYGTIIDHTADWISAMSLIVSSIIIYKNFITYWILFLILVYLQSKNFLYCGYIQQYNDKTDIALSRILQKQASTHENVKIQLAKLKEFCSSNQFIYIFFMIYTLQYLRNNNYN